MEKEIFYDYVVYKAYSEEEFEEAKNIISGMNDDKRYSIKKIKKEEGITKELPYRYDKNLSKFNCNTLVYVVSNKDEFSIAELRIKSNKDLFETLVIRHEEEKENHKLILVYSYKSNKVLERVDEVWVDKNGNAIREIEYTPEMKEISCYEYEFFPNGEAKLRRLLDEDRNILEEELLD